MTIILLPVWWFHINAFGWLFSSILFVALGHWWIMASHYSRVCTTLYEDRIESLRWLRKKQVVAFRDVEAVRFVRHGGNMDFLCALTLKTANKSALFFIPQKALEGRVQELYQFLLLVTMAKMTKRIRAGEEIAWGKKVFWKRDAIYDRRKMVEKILRIDEILGVIVIDYSIFGSMVTLVPKPETNGDKIRFRSTNLQKESCRMVLDLFVNQVPPATIDQLSDAILFAVDNLRDPRAAMRLACLLDTTGLFEAEAFWQHEKAVKLDPDDPTLKVHLENALQRSQKIDEILETLP